MDKTIELSSIIYYICATTQPFFAHKLLSLAVLCSCLLTEAAVAAPVKFFLVFAYHPEKVGAKTNVHKSYKKNPVRFKVNVISRGYNYLVGEMNVFCIQVKVYPRIFLGISEGNYIGHKCALVTGLRIASKF